MRWINRHKILRYVRMDHFEANLMVYIEYCSGFQKTQDSNLVGIVFLIKRQNGECDVTWFLFGTYPDVPAFKVRVYK